MGKKTIKEMNKRCPRKLKCFPSAPCPLAVQRLRGLKKASKNVSYTQEAKVKGCNWYIADKDSNYCFFKYIHDNEGEDHSTIIISEKLNITQAAVYSSLNRAIEKLKKTPLYTYLKKMQKELKEDE